MSDEELSTTVNGKVTDTPLQDHILDNANANAATRLQSRKAAVADGMSEKQANRLFGRNREAR